jgi:phosphatidylglycerophosphatase C
VSSNDERVVAAFDFDGTLTRRDTLVPFLARLVGWPRVATALATCAPSLAKDRDASKERLLSKLLAGIPVDEITSAGRRYGGELVDRKLRPEMRERVEWHRSQGHDVVIVSASLDVYLAEVARRLGANALCTTLEVDAIGVATGRIVGRNCRGPEKASRLRDYLGDADVTLWAYGDSSGDREMLAMADHAFRHGAPSPQPGDPRLSR